jgi:hypothetical protein
MSEEFVAPSIPTHSEVNVSPGDGRRLGTLKFPITAVNGPPSNSYPDQFAGWSVRGAGEYTGNVTDAFAVWREGVEESVTCTVN